MAAMNNSLCSFCQDIFQGSIKPLLQYNSMGLAVAYPKLREGEPHHNSIVELRDCGLQSCRLCARLWSSIPEWSQKAWLKTESSTQSAHSFHMSTEQNRTQLRYDLSSHGAKEWQISLRNATFYWDSMAAGFRLCYEFEHLDLTALKPRGSIDSTFSPTGLAKIKDWSSTCWQTHRKCHASRDNSWLPSRLLHVGRDSGNVQPALHHQSKIPRPTLYFTLSHAWGTKHTLQLTTARLSEFSSGIPLSSFPATYRDAILLTRALGIEYIWIDSLCIIQDSPLDWRQECTAMASVYKNGVMNILALHANDGDGGCFALRDDNLFKPLVVQTAWPGLCDKMWLLKPGQSWDTKNSPLLKRGWVVQERLLPARLLGFSKQQISWDCREASVSEFFPPKRPWNWLYEEMSFPGKKDLSLISEMLESWKMLVSRYSTTALSHADDKLVAFSGIARTFQHVLERTTNSDWTYLAGLWRPYLEYQLVWNRFTPEAGPRPTRPSQYRAPSWTWASTDGGVLLMYGVFLRVGKAELLIDIRHAHVEPTGQDPFLQVASAYLKLHCLLFRLGPTYQKNPYSPDLGMGLTWDVEDLTKHPEEPIYLLPIMVYFDDFNSATRDTDTLNVTLIGLIVQQVGESFRRAGVFEVRYGIHGETHKSGKSIGDLTWVRDIVTILHKRGSIASYSYKGLFPVVGDDDKLSNLWIRHSITLI